MATTHRELTTKGYGANVEVLLDGTPSARLSIDSMWFGISDLKEFRKYVKELEKELERF